MAQQNFSSDSHTVTVRVPISIRRRGGRKMVVAPDGTSGTPASRSRHVDNAMVKAIARAFHWREMLESGTHTTIREIAGTEKINGAYVGRVLRLNLLAPDIIEEILNGHQPSHMVLAMLMEPFPMEWKKQPEKLLAPKR